MHTNKPIPSKPIGGFFKTDTPQPIPARLVVVVVVVVVVMVVVDTMNIYINVIHIYIIHIYQKQSRSRCEVAGLSLVKPIPNRYPFKHKYIKFCRGAHLTAKPIPPSGARAGAGAVTGPGAGGTV